MEQLEGELAKKDLNPFLNKNWPLKDKDLFKEAIYHIERMAYTGGVTAKKEAKEFLKRMKS